MQEIMLEHFFIVIGCYPPS
uniref:Uncharacterized protein n=1 Tax=Vitis vinifera TaxID=29760 RepID=F6HJ06_VITVI